MKQRVIMAVFGALLIFAALGSIKSAYAISKIGAGYTITNYYSLITTLLTFHPNGTERPREFLDGYARLFHCNLVKEKYSNEFEWRKVRETVNTEIDKLDREYYSYYEFTGPIYLEKYDFRTNSFPLAEDSSIKHVGFLTIYTLPHMSGSSYFCGDFFERNHLQRLAPIDEFLPGSFSIKLDRPLTIPNIKVDIDDAKKFVNTLTRRGSTERKVYVRFRVKLTSYLKMNQKLSRGGDAMFNGIMQEVDIYFDEGLTNHFAKIKI